METPLHILAQLATLPGEAEPFTRRGIPALILLEQVQNTAPFLFDPTVTFATREPHLQWLRNFSARVSPTIMVDISHLDYFRLCLFAHHATVATFVPTDVDVHIRFKLWQPPLNLQTRLEMAELVLESLSWDYTRVSTRLATSPVSGEFMSGHQGEWFSTVVAAYAAAAHLEKDLSQRILEMVVNEIHRQAQIFADFKQVKDGIGLHRAATVIAHNLGDLDRVIDQWELDDDCPLKKAAYKAGHEHRADLPHELFEAGELNKAHMAIENHRHFALRRPRCLRRSPKFLLPISPFLEDWGQSIALSQDLTAGEKGEIAEFLVDGWVRLPLTVGYARALAGMESAMPGGASALWNEMPARNAKTLQTGKLRQAVTQPRERFEGAWQRYALKFLKLI